MYSTKPFHISDPREGLLATTIFFAIFSILFSYLVYLVAMESAISDLRIYIALFLLPFLTFGYGYGFLKTHRVEFFDDFVRVVGKRGRPNKDIRYSEMNLGPLSGGGRNGAYTFDISVKGINKPNWRVWNERIAGSKTTIYGWLRGRMDGTLEPASIMFSGATRPSFVRRHPFLIAALGVISIMMVGVYIGSLPATTKSELLLNGDIAIGTVGGGVMALVFMWVSRRIILDRQTNR